MGLLILFVLSWGLSLPISPDTDLTGTHFLSMQDDAHLAPAIIWEHSYPLQYSSYAWIGHEFQDGSFIIAGIHPSAICFDWCTILGWLMRINQDGAQIWYQLNDNYSVYYPVRLLTIDSSSFLLAGTAEIHGLFPELDRFITLHWIDTDGNWFRNISLTQWKNHWLIDVIPLHNGSFIVLTTGIDAFWINATGALLSNHSYAPPSFGFQTIASGCQDGGFIMMGQNRTVKPNGLSILRVNESGSVLWSKYYQSSKDLQPSHISEDSGGDFLVVGTLGNETTIPPTSLWLTRINASGNTIWILPMETQTNDVVTGLTQTDNGDYLIAGNRDIRLYCWRVNNLGDVVWESDFGGDLDGTFADIITCQNGDYVAIGTDNTISSDRMPLVRRFDEQMAPTSPTLFNIYLPHPFPHFLLAWSASSDVDGAVVGYRLEISPSATFSNNVTSLYLTSNSTSIMPSTHRFLYYRVAAIDDRGTLSYWSNAILINFDGLILLYNLILATTIGILVVVIIITSFIFVRYKQKKKW